MAFPRLWRQWLLQFSGHGLGPGPWWYSRVPQDALERVWWPGQQWCEEFPWAGVRGMCFGAVIVGQLTLPRAWVANSAEADI